MKGFGILQLPSISSLKAFTSFNIEAAGTSEERLAFARSQYDAMMEEKRSTGQLVPFNEGVLIFDEVKVGLKVHYHAKSGKLIGLAMSVDELASLRDVYETLQSEHRTEKASYVLQYLWRCTASNFDVIGPYFTSGTAMSAQFIIASLFETIHSFHLYSFETKAILCDGASTNLCAIKLLTGFGSGAFGINASLEDKHNIKTWFLNPLTNQKVYTLICPSHQVHTLLGNALFPVTIYTLFFYIVKEHGGCIVLISDKWHQIFQF